MSRFLWCSIFRLCLSAFADDDDNVQLIQTRILQKGPIFTAADSAAETACLNLNGGSGWDHFDCLGTNGKQSFTEIKRNTNNGITSDYCRSTNALTRKGGAMCCPISCGANFLNETISSLGQSECLTTNAPAGGWHNWDCTGKCIDANGSPCVWGMGQGKNSIVSYCHSQRVDYRNAITTCCPNTCPNLWTTTTTTRSYDLTSTAGQLLCINAYSTAMITWECARLAVPEYCNDGTFSKAICTCCAGFSCDVECGHATTTPPPPGGCSDAQPKCLGVTCMDGQWVCGGTQVPDVSVCPGTDGPGGDTDVTDADCLDAERGFGPDFTCANTEMYCSSDSGDGLTVGACCPTKCKKEFEKKKKNSNVERKGKNEAERKAKRASNEGTRKKNEKDRKKKRKDTEWNSKRDAKESENKNAEDERKTKRGWKEGQRKNERSWKNNRRQRLAAANKREAARKARRAESAKKNGGDESSKKNQQGEKKQKKKAAHKAKREKRKKQNGRKGKKPQRRR